MLRTFTTTLLVAFAFVLTTSTVKARTIDPAVHATQEAGARQSPKPAAEPLAININTATAAELEKLPGVGPATALRILEYREKNGAFKKVEDLMNVRGIGEKTFLTLKPLINVAPPKGHVW
jgi:comEA protein